MSLGASEEHDGSTLLLGIDVGTSRLKAAVYDAGLRLVREASIETRSLESSHPGELDADDLWRRIQDLLTDLLRRTGLQAYRGRRDHGHGRVGLPH